MVTGDPALNLKPSAGRSIENDAPVFRSAPSEAEITVLHPFSDRGDKVEPRLTYALKEQMVPAVLFSEFTDDHAFFFSLHTAETAHALHARHPDLDVHPLQALTKTALRLKGRSEEAFRNIQMFYEPVSPSAAAADIEAAAEDAARFQNAEGLPVSRLLVRKGMKSVHAHHQIDALLFVWQGTHISLL